MREERIDELFNHAEADGNDELTRKIQKGIRNNIYKRAAVVVAAAILLFGVISYGGRAVKEKQSFHLSDWEAVVSEEQLSKTADRYQIQNGSELKDILNAQAYISAYSSIFLPGIVPEFSEPDSLNAHAITNGTYQIGGKLIDYFEVNPENEDYFVKAEDNDSYICIKDGKIIADQSRNILNAGSRVLKHINAYEPYSGLEEGDFYSHFRNEGTDYKTLAYCNEIRKLPSSAMICMDIRLKESVTVYNLLRAAANEEDSRIVYAVTDYIAKSDEFDECAIGFSLIGGNGPEEFKEGFQSLKTDDTLKRDKRSFQQGMFYYNNRASFSGEPLDASRIYEERYCTQLKLLIDNDLLNEREQHAAETALAHAEAGDMEVIGYRIFAARDDALKILERENTLRSHIVSVKSNMFE